MTSPLPPELERYRSVREKVAAELVGLAPMTLANMRCQRRGPVYCKVGRTIFYPLADLLSWRDAHRIDPEAGR